MFTNPWLVQISRPQMMQSPTVAREETATVPGGSKWAAEQHDLGRNGGAILAWIKIEQAEVHLDVTVSRLNPAERQDSFPCTCQMGIVIGHAGEFERKRGV